MHPSRAQQRTYAQGRGEVSETSARSTLLWPRTATLRVRSLKALNFLRQQGFKYLKSVKGREKRRGQLAALRRITAWSEEIDFKVPRY